MEIIKLPSEGNEEFSAKILIKKTTPAFVNTIRRLIVLEVPSLAIDKITMIENTSALFDEYVAHRLGLVPLWSDIDHIELHDECEDCIETTQDGCTRCTVELSMNVETDKTNERVITSSDLIPRDTGYYPIYDEIPIIKMGRDQRLELFAIAKFGRGKEHAKYNPVGTIGYKYYPDIKISKKGALLHEIVKTCPTNVFEIQNGDLVASNPVNCTLCNDCVKNSNGEVEVKGQPSDIIFTIESTGVYHFHKIIIEASEILDKKANELLLSIQDAIEELQEDKDK